VRFEPQHTAFTGGSRRLLGYSREILMPEGPEIRRAADRLERSILNQPLRAVHFAFDHLKCFEPMLAAAQIERVETRGKAMLTHFDNGYAVYSHNQLYGRWYAVKAGQPARTTRSLRFAVYGLRHDILLYSASDIDVLTAPAIEQHPFLRKLGPDVLNPALSEDQIAQRLVDPRFARRRLADLLLDQSFLAGIGNYLRSEILHAAGLLPTRKAGTLNESERDTLATAVLGICQRAYLHAGITNDLALAARLKAQDVSFGRRRHAVFEREALPCYQCNTQIQRAEMNRRVFWCSVCQR